MLLPRKIGFAEANSWRLTQATRRPQLAQYLAVLARRGRRYGKPIYGFCWKTALKGFLADWVRYESKARLAVESGKDADQQLRCDSRLFMGGK